MTPKEEARITRNRKIRYFAVTAVLYMTVYFILYLLLSLVHAIVYLGPYIRLFFLIVFFPLSVYILNKIMEQEVIRVIAGRQ